MKKTIIAMLSIVLMLFAFASCSNDSGNPGFAGDVDDVASALDPASLVSDVLKPNASGVDVEYRLIANNAKALSDGAYTLRATVTFTEYKVGSYTITDGVLVYEFVGNVSNNRFTVATGSSCTVTTDSANPLVVSTADGNVDVTINDSAASVTMSSSINVSTVGDDGIVSNSAVGAVTVTIATENTVTVDGEDVTIPEPETPDDNDPVTPPRQYITKANIAEVAASGSGTYYLSDNITLTEQLNITAPITIDGDGHTITRDTTALTSATETTNAVILISSNDVTLRNLSIDGAQNNSSAEWVDGVWGIKVYNATGVTLENITVSNINAGIQVNSSTVTVSGAIKFNNAIWGGIGVDKGSSLSNGGALTIARGTTFTTNIERKPIVYIEANSDGSVTDASSILTQVGINCGSNGGQTWYTNSDIAGRMITEASGFEDLTSGATYYLAANLGTLNSQITISKPIKLDGNGLTITRSTPTPTEGSPDNWGTKAIVLINSDGVSISNLTVSGTTETAPSEWNDGEWGIKVYDAKGVTLSNITVQNVNAGIQVNSSEVTVSDAIEFDNTWFGGIGVDKGSTLDNYGTLNVANGTTFTMDITDKPTIYTETDDNAVEGAEATGLTAYRPTIPGKTNQKWYLSAAQYSELKDSVTEISADSTTSATE